MGACNSKQKPVVQKQNIVNYNEIDTNINSDQKANKDELKHISQEESKVEIKAEQVQHKTQFISCEQIRTYLLNEELSSFSVDLNNDLIKKINEDLHFNDNQQIVDLSKEFIHKLKEIEEPIYQLDKKYPSEILQNFQQFLQPQLEELFNQNINQIKTQTLLIKGLELCVRSYHILQNLRNKSKTQKDYKQEKVQDEEQILNDELKKLYLKLQSEIKLEIIKTFPKTQTISKQNSQNNPLVLMKFNTKHAITLAKQQTIKQQAEQQDEEDSQLLLSLQDALDYYIGNEQYDTSKMKPSN